MRLFALISTKKKVQSGKGRTAYMKPTFCIDIIADSFDVARRTLSGGYVTRATGGQQLVVKSMTQMEKMGRKDKTT